MSDTLPGQLARKGHRIEVISYVRKRNAQNVLFEEPNIRFNSIDALSISIPNFVTEFPYFLNLENVVKKIKPDIIHINNLPFLTTLQSIKVAKKLGIPSIIHVHGVTADRSHFLNFLQWLYLQSWGRYLFGTTSKVICLTEQDAALVRSFGCSDNKISVIPNGVDVNKFRPNEGEESDGLILWLGRFAPEKGLYYLIKSMILLSNNAAAKTMGSNSNGNCRLLLVGDGCTRSGIEEQINTSHLESMVKINHAVPHKRVVEYLKHASIFVLPSLKEGMPYTLLEAMASGKPVVGSDISGITDVITNEQNGLLVPSMNPEALAKAILQLLNNEKLRRRLGQNARKLMVEKYSFDIINERIEKVYSEAMKSVS